MKQEKSCGAVLFTRDGGAVKYLIVDNIGASHGFPKGHVEQGESELQTATREIKEETALDVRFLDGFRVEDSYYIRGGTVFKTVVYFLAEFSAQTPQPQESEIASIELLPYEQARALLEYENAREILRKADEFLKNEICVLPFTAERLPDVLNFEKRLRDEEDVWGWEIDDAYIQSVSASFHDRRFDNSVSFLAYVGGKVVGRIDAVLIPSHFDGSVKAYLDWICVVKSSRHRGVAQAMLTKLRQQLKELGADTLIALTASNDEAQRFYRAISGSEMHDTGIWINL